jgi:hypothetical protein
VSERPSLPPLREDGLPTLPTGEPVLQRWFVLGLLALIPLTVAVTVWAFSSIDRDELTAAERRPAGGPEVTIARGEAVISETLDVEPGPGCAQAIRIVGDSGSRAAARRALDGACQLIDSGAVPAARDGLVEWVRADGQLRIATFELAGVESSTRLEDGRMVMELNAKFQFEDAIRGTPALIHQLVLLTDPAWPGEAVSATVELEAARAQLDACERVDLGPEPQRGCLDAEELLASDDPLGDLVAVGFRDDTGDGAEPDEP